MRAEPATPSAAPRRLAAPYADVRAEQLRWRLGEEARPALAALVVPVGRWHLDLRLLGASHQVLLRDADGLLCSETVACDAGGEPLPPQAELPLHHGRYRLVATVARHTAAAFPAAVEALVGRLEGDPRALVGRYRGDDRAVTAVAVDRRPGGQPAASVAWTTWHAYPQTLEVVQTRTVIDLEEVTS